MKRFIYIFLFVGFIFLFITGCSDYNEINNVMIVLFARGIITLNKYLKSPVPSTFAAK